MLFSHASTVIIVEVDWLLLLCSLIFLFFSGIRQAKSDSERSLLVITGVLMELLSFMMLQIRYNNRLLAMVPLV